MIDQKSESFQKEPGIFSRLFNLLKTKKRAQEPGLNDISRRDFLFGAGLTSLKLITDGPEKTLRDFQALSNKKDIQQKDAERESTEPQAVFIDFPLDFDRKAFAIQVMSELGFSIKDYEVEDESQFDLNLLKTDDAYAVYYGLNKYLERVEEHGKMTSEAWKETVDEVGKQNQDVVVYPVTELYTDFSYTRKEDRSIQIRFNVDKDKLHRRWLDNEDVVLNNSFQYGVQGVDILMREKISFEEFLISLEHPDTGEEYVVVFNDADLVTSVSWLEVTVPSDPNNPDSVTVPALQGVVQGEQKIFRGVLRSELSGLSTIYENNPQYKELVDPVTHIIEAYSPDVGNDNQLENIKNIYDLCNMFPDKIFVLSSGNTNSFFYEQRGQLGEFPENLLFVGLSLPDSRTPVSDGSDILVPSNLRDPYVKGSSEAAAIISGVLSSLVAEGLSISEAKTVLLTDLSIDTTYLGKNYHERTTRLLDYDKVTKYFAKTQVDPASL